MLYIYSEIFLNKAYHEGLYYVLILVNKISKSFNDVAAGPDLLVNIVIHVVYPHQSVKQRKYQRDFQYLVFLTRLITILLSGCSKLILPRISFLQ